MSEAVVVADQELPHVQLPAEHLVHEPAGRESGQRPIEMQYEGVVDLCFRKQLQFPVERRQQLRLVVCLQYLSWMAVEGDYGRCHSRLPCLVDDTSDQEPVSPVYPIEESDGSRQCRQLRPLTLFDVYDVQFRLSVNLFSVPVCSCMFIRYVHPCRRHIIYALGPDIPGSPLLQARPEEAS